MGHDEKGIVIYNYFCMKKRLYKLFKVYSQFGLLSGGWTVLRVIILPFTQIDKLIKKEALIIDVGCGAGGLANYLAISSDRRKVIGIDLNKVRIKRAQGTTKLMKNTEYIYGDVTEHKFSKADYYLICDVLHHISYEGQIMLLRSIVKKMGSKTTLIVKDVDKSNLLPFLFGHFWEKILYPREKINVRTKKQWLKVLNDLELSVKVEKGNWYFPDSTLIYVCRKK